MMLNVGELSLEGSKVRRAFGLDSVRLQDTRARERDVEVLRYGDDDDKEVMLDFRVAQRRNRSLGNGEKKL